MSISYVGNGPPTIPIPPLGSLYYDQVDGILYGAVPNKGTWYVIGGGGSGVAVPIIQKAGDGTNVTSAATVTLTATSSVMYAVSLNMETAGGASSGHTVVATLAWTSPIEGHSQSVTLHLDEGVNLVVETFPILCAANTPISMSFAYGGGAISDPYTYSVRIVEMP